jgi:WD40 repeat protein
MGASCSVGAVKAFQVLKPRKQGDSSKSDEPLNVAKQSEFTNFPFENWLSSSTLRAESKRFASLEMPAGLDSLFDEIVFKIPQEIPYKEPETDMEMRKRLKKEDLERRKLGIAADAFQETLSEEEASGGRYIRIFVWSNVEATLVHQALHQIVIPQITESCKRVGVCIVWVDFRWAAFPTLTAESSPPFLSRKQFVEMQEMVEAEMERCFCLSPLLNFLSITAAENLSATATFSLPLRVPQFIIAEWIKASRTLAAAFIEKAYPGYATASNPTEIIKLDVGVEERDKNAVEEIGLILESVCSGGSSVAKEDRIVITNEMIASLISDPTEFILRRRMKLEQGSDSGLFPLTKCKSMLSYCYYDCFDRIFSARASIKQKKPEKNSAEPANKSQGALEPMNTLPRLMELLFDMRNNVEFLHVRNNFAQKSLFGEHVTHFCSTASEHIVQRLKLAIVEREKFLPGVLEGRLHFRLMRDAVLNKCWDSSMVAIMQICWLPEVARTWQHPSPTITACLSAEKRLVVGEVVLTEKDLFKQASKGFSEESFNSEANSTALSALNDEYVEMNFWRVLEATKKSQGNLSVKEIREKKKAMKVAAKDMFQQEVTQIDADANMSELKDDIADSLQSFVEDFGLLADLMSVKRHGCIFVYDAGDSCAVSSIMNAIGMLKKKIMALSTWEESKKFSIITRSAMCEDAVCNFSDLVTSICEELAGQSITCCDQIPALQQIDFTNRTEALKLSAFLQAIPKERPTVIFCYGMQNLQETENLSADICPEKVPHWVLLIFHAVCPPLRTVETLARSSFRGKCEIFGGLSQSARQSFVAMVEQLYIAGCKALDAQELSLCKTVYCGKHGVMTTRCHIFMIGKCFEWKLFAEDPGLLKISAEIRDQPNVVIVKHYLLGVIRKFGFSKMAIFAALSLMGASRSEVPFNLIVAFIKYVKKQTADTLSRGFSAPASSRPEAVTKLLFEIYHGMTIEQQFVKTTEWNLFFAYLKIFMTPTVILRGSQEHYSLHDGILKHDVVSVTEKVVSQNFSKMVLLAVRYHEPWKIELASNEKQTTNLMKIRDLLPLAMDLGLQSFAIDLMMDFDFVSHYLESGFSRKLELFYAQVSEFADCPDAIRHATVLIDIQRFLVQNRSLFVSAKKYDLLSMLFNFNGGSLYFEAIMKFRTMKQKRGDIVNSIWIKNKSEFGKRDTLRWKSDIQGVVRAWHLMTELNSSFGIMSVEMPDPRLIVFEASTGKELWASPDKLIQESQIQIKSSRDDNFVVSSSKARVFLWKKIGTYADSGYCAVHSFQLLKHHISGLDLSPNDLNFCTYSDTEGLTVTAWSIVTDVSTIDRLDHLNLAITSVYHVGLASILKFACFLSWDDVLLTSESNGDMSLALISKSKFGLSTNPGSSLKEIIRWTIPKLDSTELRASSMQWMKHRNLLVLSNHDFVIFYEIGLDFKDPSDPIASVSPFKKLQGGFAPAVWCSNPIVSVAVIDPNIPEIGTNLADEKQNLQGTLLAIVLTKQGIVVWSSEPYSNLPEQDLVEFSDNESPAQCMLVSKKGSILLNCKDQSIMQRDLEIIRYGMVDRSPANGCINDVHFTKNDSMIVCSCKSGEVSLYSGTSGLLKICQMMNNFSISVCSAFCELTGALYSGDRNGSICCFNVKAAKMLPVLRNHQSAVTTIAISPTELMLASGDSDGNLTIWSTRSTKALFSIPNAHSDSITKVMFSADSLATWSSSSDGRVASWSCEDGQPLRASKVSDAAVQSFDVSADM